MWQFYFILYQSGLFFLDDFSKIRNNFSISSFSFYTFNILKKHFLISVCKNLKNRDSFDSLKNFAHSGNPFGRNWGEKSSKCDMVRYL